jgi:DNA-binding NarL/FixJ family response regulator
VTAAWRAGAHGYIGKDTGTPELIRAIRTIADGGMVFGGAPHP